MSEPRAARLPAMAKLNLDLRVLHRRPDGFHELRTLFQTISLADRIDVEVQPGSTADVQLESATDIPDNLILRAARLVLEETGRAARVRFRLFKKIPMGGGLGGGSTDAAAVLLGLPVLLGSNIPLTRLLEMGAQLGSDVPCFLLGGTLVGLGRGTELYPLPDVPARQGLVVAPPVHVATPAAYQALARPELTLPDNSRILNAFQAAASSVSEGLAERGWSLGENDFESVVFPQYPRLQSIKQALREAGADVALLTGSGSAVFGLFADRAQARQAAAAFPQERVFPITLVTRQRYRAAWARSLQAHTEGQSWPPRSQYAR